MFNVLAYLIAFVTVYRKLLFSLFVLLFSLLILLPIVKRTDPQKIVSSRLPEAEALNTKPVVLAVGREFLSLQELQLSEAANGYVKTGSFGGYWPAKVVDVATSTDRISFVRQGGRKHTYKGFSGYRLKVVKLLDGRGKETVVVFRSQGKY